MTNHENQRPISTGVKMLDIKFIRENPENEINTAENSNGGISLNTTIVKLGTQRIIGLLIWMYENR